MINLRSRSARRREWRTKERLQRSFVRGLRPRVNKELVRVGKAAAAAYKRDGSHGVEAALTSHGQNLTRILMPSYIAVGMAFGKRTLAMFGKAHLKTERKDTEEELTQRVASWAKRRAVTAQARVSATTQKRINRVIEEGIKNGDTKDEIAASIEERTGGKVGEARAELIAQTEVHSAANAAELDTVKAAGLGLEKQWLSMGDELVREDHQEVDGDQVGLDEAFDVGEDELQYPGDPAGSPQEICNCRCIMVYSEPSKD